MKYLLDTDHLSIFQRQTGLDYANLSNRMVTRPLSDFAVSIVTFHEQFLGIYTYINRAHSSDEVVHGYKMMTRLVGDFTLLPLLEFDKAAANVLDNLQSQRIKVATMDLRIAALALSKGLILLTRNSRDFGKVPGLSIEDWTI